MSVESLPKLVLTIDEVAEVLRCSRSTVKSRITSGELPSVKIRGLRRVRTADLEAYVNALPVQTEPAPTSSTAA